MQTNRPNGIVANKEDQEGVNSSLIDDVSGVTIGFCLAAQSLDIVQFDLPLVIPADSLEVSGGILMEQVRILNIKSEVLAHPLAGEVRTHDHVVCAELVQLARILDPVGFNEDGRLLGNLREQCLVHVELNGRAQHESGAFQSGSLTDLVVSEVAVDRIVARLLERLDMGGLAINHDDMIELFFEERQRAPSDLVVADHYGMIVVLRQLDVALLLALKAGEPRLDAVVNHVVVVDDVH